MKDSKFYTFLRWWVFTIGVGGLCFLVGWLGFFETLFYADISKLSFVILLIYLSLSIRCGILTCQYDKDIYSNGKKMNNTKKQILKSLQPGWFWAEICLSIGMIGTIIGFIIMMASGLENIDFTNTEQTKIMIAELSRGMGTALYTTLVGLICAVLIRIQYFYLYQAIKSRRSYKGNSK